MDFLPRVATLFTAGGTKFTLNLLPIGGFVRPKGENDPNIPDGLAAANPWKRLGSANRRSTCEFTGWGRAVCHDHQPVGCSGPRPGAGDGSCAWFSLQNKLDCFPGI